MKTNTKLSIAAIMAISFAISSCKKDNNKELPKVAGNELITTVKLQFTNAANPADVKSFTWRDIDGQGGDAPVSNDIVLAANTNYKLEVADVLNETTSPVEDVKEEVKEEDYDHLFVYKPTADLLSINITDKDKNNFNVGLKADVRTGSAKTGDLQVILRHQPGVKNGTEAPGSTDFDVTFKVKIINAILEAK